MMKLNYSSSRTITTADMFDACDPPLIFEVRTRVPRGWASIDLDFSEDGHKNTEMAKRMIAGAFLTVSDGEGTYQIQTIEQVEELRQAIEIDNPGDGDSFLCSIAWGFSSNYYKFIGDHLGNSLRPSPQLNGNGQEEIKVAEVS